MVRESQVLLGNLELHHHLGILQSSEERAERFPWLEVHRTVLDLDHDVVRELSVKRFEFLDCLVRPVRARRSIYEGSPHNDAAVRGESLGEHVGAVRMGAAVVLRTFLTFGIRFHEEASEIRDKGVDFIRLVFPPLPDLRIERVSCPDSVQSHRRGPLD